MKNLSEGAFTYKTLEVIGPEHEYSLVNQDLSVLPIADKVLKAHSGRIVNFIELPEFTFGKELQLHVMEIKANQPFKSPVEFEETMNCAVSRLGEIVHKHGASLLGTGMHPLLKFDETGVWPHYHRKIYHAYGKLFNLKRHGWLNIQSFHLNLPYEKETDAIQIHNQLANLCAYLPAITAASPIFEGKNGPDINNRLRFYKENQKEVPSIAGDIIPEYVASLNQYKHEVIRRYSQDLAVSGADKTLLNREWVNSRGIIFRFDRRALEVRVMDEQECIKMDVALACFIRSTLRGLLASNVELLPHEILVKDFNAVIRYGLNAKVFSPHGKTAKQVCQHYFNIATAHADAAEKRYLWLVKRRIEEGNLSELIRAKIQTRTNKTSVREAIIDVYSTLIKCLGNNEPF